MKLMRNDMIIGILGLTSGLFIGFLITTYIKLNKSLIGNQQSGKAIVVIQETHYEKISLYAKPTGIEIEIPRTALIAVDMQNSFAAKSGMLSKLGLFFDKNKKIIQPIQKVLKATREAGMKIIYLRMVYRPDLSNAGGTESPNYWKEIGVVAMREMPEFKGKFITEGTWDSEIIEELKPQPGDIIVNKSRYSGFVNSELHAILQTYNIKYLMFVGIATNVCVESTIRDAYFHEYFPILVSDCVVPVGPDYIQEATIFNVQNFFGWVTTSDDLIKSISEKRSK